MSPSTAPPVTALTTIEQHPAMVMLEGNARALVELLPGPAAVDRFKRVVIQALTKDPKLARCTPASIVNAVIDAATWGLEPSGRHGGAYLVPYRVNVGTRERPDYEMHAQMIPDYRGLIEVITRPPSEIEGIKAYEVREGDLFEYELGTEPRVKHVPSLAPDRSRKPLTHTYAWAWLRSGTKVLEAMDRAWAERIRDKARAAFGPWATDFDRMALKTNIKLLANTLPIRPDVRALISRDDEIEGEAREQALLAAPSPTGPTKAARLGQRLRQERLPATADTASTDSAAATASSPHADGGGEAGEASPAAVEQTVEGEVVSETPTPAAATACDDEDASPMALGFCGLAPGHGGAHKSKAGTWPNGRRQ